MSRKSAESLHDRAAMLPEGPTRTGRLIAARDVLARACEHCWGYGPQARIDGHRWNGAGPDAACPSCGAKASDHYAPVGGAL